MPFLGEVRLFGGNFPPAGWMFCDGQLLSIPQNVELFHLLGTRFGGDGVQTFALPDLRGRVPLHPGQGPGLSLRQLGESAGAENHALTTQEMPVHTHAMRASTGNGTSTSPANGALSRMPSGIPQYAAASDANLAGDALALAGGGQSHNNMQPYLTVIYIIAVQGTVPTP